MHIQYIAIFENATIFFRLNCLKIHKRKGF